MFIELCKDALKESNLFCNFIDFMDKEWMNTVKPKNVSIFLQETRTKSGAESFNTKLGERFRTHGNLYHFIECLQAKELVSTDYLENHLGGTVQNSYKKKIFEKRSKFIIKYSAKLDSGGITPKYFLNLVANVKNEVLFDDNEISSEP